MIAVIFEVMPQSGRTEDYFDRAAQLKSELEKVDGFVSVERFASLTTEGKFLSLSIWRDEDAIRTWRENVKHRAAQHAGRGGIFADYRLRVATVIRDYGMFDRLGAPLDTSFA